MPEFCRYCGNKLDKDAVFCPKCGQKVVRKRGKKNLCYCCALVFALSLIAALLIIVKETAFHNAAITEAEYNDYIFYDQAFLDIEKAYCDEEGYVEPEVIPALLDEIEGEIAKGIEDGVIMSYERGQDNIYVKFSGGITYLFIPYQKDMLAVGEAGKICTLEPVEYDWRVKLEMGKATLEAWLNKLEYNGSYDVEACAEMVTKAFPGQYAYQKGWLSSEDAGKGESVTIERLKKLDPYKLIIFEGHGVFTSKTHSALITGESYIGFEAFSRYSEDIKEERITLTSFNLYDGVRRYYAVTAKFFDTYLSGLEDTIVFLGACESGKDDVLAKSFLDKGAAVVLGYSEETSMQYEMLTRTMFFYALAMLEKDGRNYTVQEAYEYAQNTIGKKDFLPMGKNAAELLIFAEDEEEKDYTLDGIKPADSSHGENETWNSAYHDVLLQYYNVINNETITLQNRTEHDIVNYVLYYDHEKDYRGSFAIADIDGNGTPELLIGAVDSILDIYTWQNGKLIRLLRQPGERANLRLCEGGILYETGSGGAASQYEQYYRIREDGKSCELFEYYHVESDSGDGYAHIDVEKVDGSVETFSREDFVYDTYCDLYPLASLQCVDMSPENIANATGISEMGQSALTEEEIIEAPYFRMGLCENYTEVLEDYYFRAVSHEESANLTAVWDLDSWGNNEVIEIKLEDERTDELRFVDTMNRRTCDVTEVNQSTGETRTFNLLQDA